MSLLPKPLTHIWHDRVAARLVCQAGSGRGNCEDRETNVTKDAHGVYQFPGAAVTECHTLRGLKQQSFPFSQF